MPKENEILDINDDSINWSAIITFVGKSPCEDMATFTLPQRGTQVADKIGRGPSESVPTGMANSAVPKVAMLTRPLAWWPYHQGNWTNKHSGMHPK